LLTTFLAAALCVSLSACGSSDSSDSSGSADSGGSVEAAAGGSAEEAAGGSMAPTMAMDDTAKLEVAGLWDDNFGGWTLIDSEKWGDYAVNEFDNEANWAITQNAADDEYNPSKYNYVVWTEAAEDGSWWTCTVAFGIETIEAARTTENTSDDSDPANSGCGDFGWTKMTTRSPIELKGMWGDNYDGMTTITMTSWGDNRIHAYDNDKNWAVTQNAADAEYEPSKYNYVVWTQPADDKSWWTCTVAFGIETLDEAKMTENTSDDADPEMGGCGDFPWTKMTPAQ
jgi:hypothetical protein